MPYPDQAYEAQEEENFYPDAFGQPQYQQPAWNPAPVQRRKNRTALWAMVSFICLMILALIGFGVYRMYEPNVEFEKKLNVVSQQTFAQGVIVDNVHVGGMTREQAKAALLQSAGYAA